MIVGVDIGGSGVRAASVHGGAVRGPVLRVPLRDREVITVIDAVDQVVRRLEGFDASRPEARVGVGVPGFVREGSVLASPNFPSWHDVALKRLLRERLGVPVAVENDANAATLGVSARFEDCDLVLLTLGTGVGGGVISEGRLLRGRAGTAAELGHLHVGGDRECNCGGQGCLEQWCSTTGLRRSAREVGRPAPDGEAIVAAARAREPWAREITTEAGRRLGIALTSLVNLFAPQVIALAGGLSQAPDLLAGPAEAWLDAHAIPANRGLVTLHWIGPADELAILGSARAAEGRA